MTYKQVERMSVGATFTLIGKCLYRLYAEYEIPLLYAALCGIVTWSVIHNM